MKNTTMVLTLLLVLVFQMQGQIVERRLNRMDDTVSAALTWLKSEGGNGAVLILEAKNGRGFLEFKEDSIVLEIAHTSLDLDEFERAESLLPGLGFEVTETEDRWGGRTVVNKLFRRNFRGDEAAALEVTRTLMLEVFRQRQNAPILIEKLD